MYVKATEGLVQQRCCKIRALYKAEHLCFGFPTFAKPQTVIAYAKKHINCDPPIERRISKTAKTLS